MATAYTAPEYNREKISGELGAQVLAINAYGGDVGAKMAIISDTMLLGKIPSLATLTDGWMGIEALDTNATATLVLKLELTDGTDTITALASIAAGNSGVQTFTRFDELTTFLGTKLSNANRNWWDVKATTTTAAATAGTAGIIRVVFQYHMFEGYVL